LESASELISHLRAPRSSLGWQNSCLLLLEL
jgi:hypothetical protein